MVRTSDGTVYGISAAPPESFTSLTICGCAHAFSRGAEISSAARFLEVASPVDATRTYETCAATGITTARLHVRGGVP